MKRNLMGYLGMSLLGAMFAQGETYGSFKAGDNHEFKVDSSPTLSQPMYFPTKSQQVKSKRLRASNKRQGRV